MATRPARGKAEIAKQNTVIALSGIYGDFLKSANGLFVHSDVFYDQFHPMNGIYSFGGRKFRVVSIHTKCVRILTAGFYRRRENTIRKLKTEYALTVVLKQVLTNENENKNYLRGSQKKNKNFTNYICEEFDPRHESLLTYNERLHYDIILKKYKNKTCLCTECISVRKLYLRCLIAYRMLGLRRFSDSLVPAIEAVCHSTAPTSGTADLGEDGFTSGPATSSVGDAATTGTTDIVRDVGPGGTIAAVSAFHDAQVGDTMRSINLANNPEDSDIQSAGTDLKQFLARPVLIHTYSYGSGPAAEVTFKPWTLFMNSPAIRKKVDNYTYFRGVLKMKTVVNCSPFFYGGVFYSYYPQAIAAPLGPTNNLPQLTQANNYLVEPQKSKGGEMVMPFFYTSKVCPVETAFLNDLGTVLVSPLTSLLSASTTAPQTIQLRTYAWLESVELLATTAYAQGRGAKGAKEAPSMTVAKALTSLPVVGGVFETVGDVAKGIGDFASALGFSSAPTDQCTEPFTNRAYPAMAVSTLDRPIEKLTLDHQSETNMDPSSVGLEPVDEMDLQYVLRKECCMGFARWVPEVATANTTLISFTADPSVRNEYNVPGVGRAIVASPMGYLSPLFHFWRGSINVRMKILRTTYHRGRLKVTWDPRSNNAPSDTDYHVRKTHIIDIEEQDEFEFSCPFHNVNVWSRIELPTNTYQRLKFNDGVTSWSTFGSGILNVSVETPLISAGGTDPIYILFYVRAGDDFEFSNPRKLLNRMWPNYNPNPVSNVPSLVAEEEGELAETQGDMDLGKKVSNSMSCHSSHVGEKIYSLRTLCERMAFFRTEFGSATTSVNGFIDFEMTQNALPWGRGFYTGLAGGSKFVYYEIPGDPTKKAMFENVSTPVMTWITNMYAGRRGSINYYFTPQNFYHKDTLQWAARSEEGSRRVFTAITDSASPDNTVNLLPESRAGASFTVSTTDPGLRISVPNYNYEKFYKVNRNDRDGAGGTPRRAQGVTAGVRCPVSNATENVWLSVFVAAGHDYQCLYFTFCPMFWIANSETPPLGVP